MHCMAQAHLVVVALNSASVERRSSSVALLVENTMAAQNGSVSEIGGVIGVGVVGGGNRNLPNMVAEPGIQIGGGPNGGGQNLGGQQLPIPVGGTPESMRGRNRSRSSGIRRRTQTPLPRAPSMQLNFGGQQQTQQTQPHQAQQPQQQQAQQPQPPLQQAPPPPFGMGNFFPPGTPTTQPKQQQQQQPQQQQQQYNTIHKMMWDR